MNIDEKVIAIVAVTVITVVGVVFLGDKDLVQYGILAVGSLAGSGGVSSIVSTFGTRKESDGKATKILPEK